MQHRSVSLSCQKTEHQGLTVLLSLIDQQRVELSWTLTLADEAFLGDGLLAYITALGLLEWLQLEGVRVDALQLVGLRGERGGEER